MRSNQLHRNRPLENISLAYTPEGFIGDLLSPKYMVEHESDTYYVYSKDTMSLPETIRADGAESNRANFNLSTASYQLTEHALHEDITDRQRDNADKAIKLDVDVTEFLTSRILTRRELDLQNIVQTTTSWGNSTSLTSTLAWSANTTTSNPITLIDSVSSVILLNAAKMPNVIAMNDQAFMAAKEHTSIVDRVKYTSMQSVGPDLLARLFNVDKVLVAKVTYNTGDEGVGDTISRIWSDTVFVGYIDPTPGLKRISALATFWKKNTGMPWTVKKWREEKLSADRVEVGSMFQNRAISSDCGYIIIDTVQ